MKNYYFSPCPRGLEELLAEDVTACGAADVKVVPGGVSYSGDMAVCYKVNLESRIATRVLWQQGAGSYRKEEDVYQLAKDIAWPVLFSPDQTMRVYVTATRSPLKSLEYITLKIKDAICDAFRADTGRRPSIDTRYPEVRVHAFFTEQHVTFYLDTSGEALYQRGHKIAKVEAPIKENLAAGILRLAGWKPGIPLLDPMCGSGTFLIEAAHMSLGEAPGLSRDPGEFGFERLKSFTPRNAELWQTLRREAAARRLNPDSLPIWGADISADAVARTRQNLDYAGIDDLVSVEQADLLTMTPPEVGEMAEVGEVGGMLVTNPPYGERLGDDDELMAFYPQLGDALKKRFAGWNCWFLTADPALPKLIGLKARRRTPIFNGQLECRVFNYPMVAGSARKPEVAGE